MPSSLIPLHINRPGVLGVNTQDSEGVLPGEFATVAQNLTLDSKGRLRVRPGSYKLGTSGGYGEQLVCLPANGEPKYYYATTSRTVYQLDTDSLSGTYGQWVQCTVQTNPSGYWRGLNGSYWWAELGGKVFMSAIGAPNQGAWSGYQSTDLGQFNYTTGAPYFRHCIAAGGRIFGVSSTSVYWSGLLDVTDWTYGGAGGAGYIDLRNVWPEGDIPWGIAVYNNFLVIFGKGNILVYTGWDDDPSTNMVLHDTIPGIGLIHAKTIQSTGNDLLFVSAGGVASLGRVIQEKSMPLSLVTPQVQDDIRAALNAGVWTSDEISSAYSKRLGLYVVHGPVGDSFVVHTKQRDAQGFMPVTTESTWDVVANDPGEELMLVDYASASVGPCRINLDYSWDRMADETDTTGGTILATATYTSGWLDFSEVDLADREKILKELRVLFEGTVDQAVENNQYSVYLYADYDDSTAVWSSTGNVLPWTTGFDVHKKVFDVGGEYEVLKIKITLSEPESRAVLSKLSFMAKAGKVTL